MKSLHYIFLAILFASGFLFGAQIPNFVDQYEKRIDAHYLEVNENFKGFQEIADRFHNGSIETLIKKHEDSTDSTFKSEAEPLRKIFDRKIRFERELQALQTAFIKKVWHVALAGDQEIIEETYRNYSVNLPLNTNSILSGVSIALALIILFELLIILFKSVLKMGRHTKQPA